MSGLKTGLITQWDDAAGNGLVTENGDGVHVLDASDCSDTLLAFLRGKAIPPDKPVPVTFDVDIRNHAINVDLAVTLESAEAVEMVAKEVEPKKAPGKRLPKKAAKKAAGKKSPKRAARKAATKRPARKNAAKPRRGAKKSRRPRKKRR
jgi:hypothetical protein